MEAKVPDDLKEAWRDLGVPAPRGQCIRCKRIIHDDGTPIEWECVGCSASVCRGCTLTLPDNRRDTWSLEPGHGGAEYFHQTLCSVTCWERVGRPEE